MDKKRNIPKIIDKKLEGMVYGNFQVILFIILMLKVELKNGLIFNIWILINFSQLWNMRKNNNKGNKTKSDSLHRKLK